MRKKAFFCNTIYKRTDKNTEQKNNKKIFNFFMIKFDIICAYIL